MPRTHPPQSIKLHLPPLPIASSSKLPPLPLPSSSTSINEPSMDTLLQARAIAASKGEVFDLGAFLTPARLNEYLGVNLDSLVRDEDASLENGLSSDNPLSLSQSQSNSQTQIPGQNQTQTQIEEKKRKYNIAGLANLHWTQRKKQLRLMEEARLEQEALSLLNTGAEDGDGKDGGTPGGTPVPGNIGTPGPSTVFPLLVGKGKDPESEKASIISSASYWNSLLIQARKARGPQWDYNTQSYHLDRTTKQFYTHLPKPAPPISSIPAPLPGSVIGQSGIPSISGIPGGTSTDRQRQSGEHIRKYSESGSRGYPDRAGIQQGLESTNRQYNTQSAGGGVGALGGQGQVFQNQQYHLQQMQAQIQLQQQQQRLNQVPPQQQQQQQQQSQHISQSRPTPIPQSHSQSQPSHQPQPQTPYQNSPGNHNQPPPNFATNGSYNLLSQHSIPNTNPNTSPNVNVNVSNINPNMLNQLSGSNGNMSNLGMGSFAPHNANMNMQNMGNMGNMGIPGNLAQNTNNGGGNGSPGQLGNIGQNGQQGQGGGPGPGGGGHFIGINGLQMNGGGTLNQLGQHSGDHAFWPRTGSGVGAGYQ